MENLQKINKLNTYEDSPKKLELKEYLSYLESFTNEIFQKEQRIDFGKSADVFRDPLNGYCYKVVTRQMEALLKVEDEAQFLLELQSLKSEVKVPNPLFSLEATVKDEVNGKLKNKSILCMETLNGTTLKDIFDRKKELPENFDIIKFCSALGSFIKTMNEEYGIYHRDLHEGNVMIDNETGMPCVFDFGLSKKKVLTDEDPYKTEVDIRNQIFTFQKDQEQVIKLENRLKDFYVSKKGIPFEGFDEVFHKEVFSFKNAERMNLTEIHTFKELLEDNLKDMKEQGLNAKAIEGSQGLWLVKNKTEEFEKRKDNNLIIYPKLFEGETYFICRN